MFQMAEICLSCSDWESTPESLGGTASSVSLVSQCFQSMEEITEEIPVTDEEGEEVEEDWTDEDGMMDAVRDGRDEETADSDVTEFEERLRVRPRVLLKR